MLLPILVLCCLLPLTLCGESAAPGVAIPTPSDDSEKWVHPFYDEPFFLCPILGRNFVKDFDPRRVNTINQTNVQELARQMAPEDPRIPYDAEQILKSPNLEMGHDFADTANMNADLGIQYTLRTLLRNEVLVTRDQDGVEHPAYVILSHGHSVAGLVELLRMNSTDKAGRPQHLFDTSVYLPMGGWTTNMERIGILACAVQVWGDEIERIRASYRASNIQAAGGVAIALNGHRGDYDPDSRVARAKNHANIEPVRMLGKPDAFASELASRGIRRVVVVVEHLVKDPNKANVLTLEALGKGKHKSFNHANQDLYKYMKILKRKGVEVIVVSGEQRTDPDGV